MSELTRERILQMKAGAEAYRDAASSSKTMLEISVEQIALCNMALAWLEVQPRAGEAAFVGKSYNADKGEQTTICDVCGNANLAHDRAKWSEDGSSFCPPCFPQSFSPSLPEPK